MSDTSEIIKNYNCPKEKKHCDTCKVDYSGEYSECPLCKKKRESSKKNSEIKERIIQQKIEAKEKSNDIKQQNQIIRNIERELHLEAQKNKKYPICKKCGREIKFCTEYRRRYGNNDYCSLKCAGINKYED